MSQNVKSLNNINVTFPEDVRFVNLLVAKPELAFIKVDQQIKKRRKRVGVGN